MRAVVILELDVVHTDHAIDSLIELLGRQDVPFALVSLYKLQEVLRERMDKEFFWNLHKN